MSRPKKKDKPGVDVGGKYTPLRHDISDSAAYIKLSGNSAKLYLYLVKAARTVAWKLKLGNDREVHFDYTYSEAKKFGFSESTFIRSMKELWSCGFIDVISIGGRTASEVRGRVPSKYRLCGLWKAYGDNWTDRTKHESFPWKARVEPKEGDHGRW